MSRVLHGRLVRRGARERAHPSACRATDDAQRSKLPKAAPRRTAEDYANGFLFQLARTGVAHAKLRGLWKNAPSQANDLTDVHWVE